MSWAGPPGAWAGNQDVHKAAGESGARGRGRDAVPRLPCILGPAQGVRHPLHQHPLRARCLHQGGHVHIFMSKRCQGFHGVHHKSTIILNVNRKMGTELSGHAPYHVSSYVIWTALQRFCSGESLDGAPSDLTGVLRQNVFITRARQGGQHP